MIDRFTISHVKNGVTLFASNMEGISNIMMGKELIGIYQNDDSSKVILDGLVSHDAINRRKSNMEVFYWIQFRFRFSK